MVDANLSFWRRKFGAKKDDDAPKWDCDWRAHGQYKQNKEAIWDVAGDNWFMSQSTAHMFPWPKEGGILPVGKKGKNLLINDTFIRVDGVNWVAVRSNIGQYMPIEVITAHDEVTIQTPKCEGYVLHPMPRWIKSWNPLHLRCMTPREVKEAEKDHELVRWLPQRMGNVGFETLKGEWYNTPEHNGDNETNLRTQAFNRVLHRKREELARKWGNGYDWEKLITSTFKDQYFTLFPDQNRKPGRIEDFVDSHS